MDLKLIVDIIEEYSIVAVELYNIRALKDQGTKGLGDREVELSRQEAKLHNKFLQNTPSGPLWYNLIVNVSGLCESNSRTGANDKLRGNLRKQYDAELEGTRSLEFLEKFAKSERDSRFWCEQRCLYRTKIDGIFEKLVKL